MITASTNSHNELNPASRLSPRGRNQNGTDRSVSPSKKYIKDPHASLNVFQEEQEERRPLAPNPVGPRESHKPAPREMSDLFAAGHEDYEPAGTGTSPRKAAKENVVAPKGGAHKNFQPSRLFGEDDSPAEPEKKLYKTNPARYDHFDIGDSFDDTFQHRSENLKPQNMPIRPKSGRNTQHNGHWEFEDMVTPEKTKQKVREQDVVHFGFGDDNKGRDDAPARQPGKGRKDQETHFEMQDNGTPVYQANVHKPRKDADPHFTFTDEPTPAPRRIVARNKDAARLYDDPVFDEAEGQRPLAPISNNARKEFHSYWDMGDASDNGKASKPAPQRRGLESQWNMGDDNNTAPKKQQTAVQQGRERNDSFWDF